ncbi:MAG: DUF1295 domain-containing protein [Paludibacter sp.]|nr:DUF1295 domain-containing protein [Paludibacter sp.]
MDMYGQQNKSIPQKITIFILEMVLLWVAYQIMFGMWNSLVSGWIGTDVENQSFTRKVIVFIFSLIVFFRINAMMFFWLKRKIPWEESFSIPFAFALYFIGFAIFVLTCSKVFDWFDYLGIFIFLLGSFLNTFSEIQRNVWKKKPEHKGQLYTKGLFGLSMHINFFGDVLWVTAYAMLTRNWYAGIIPLWLFCFFAFYNIPKLDHYLSGKYGQQFEAYKSSTKKFIPFIY